MRVHITRKSSNKKTGPIPVTTTESASCPPSCPFINAGCYAKSGPLALHWRKVSSGERGTDWQGLCDFVQSLPEHQLWRHNQAGDLPHLHGVIDHAALAHLVVANTGRRGFTYTHHTLTPENVSMLTRSNRQGFTVNASTESLDRADHAMSWAYLPLRSFGMTNPFRSGALLEIAWWSVQRRHDRTWHVLTVNSAPRPIEAAS